MKNKEIYFNDIVKNLSEFWTDKGCEILEEFKEEGIGAGTMHPNGTFFRCLDQKESKVAFMQQCVRPEDASNSRFKDLYRSNKFYQYQVLITPFNSIEKHPFDILKDSLEYISPNFAKNNLIEILEDNWKSPSIGAFGIGYEVRVNGLEIAQITYIQKMGGIELKIPSLEITYGLDRIAMIIQNKLDIRKVRISKDGEIKTLKHMPLISKAISKEDADDELWMVNPTCFIGMESENELENYNNLLKHINIFNHIFSYFDIPHKAMDETIQECMAQSKKIANAYIKRNNISFDMDKIDVNLRYIDLDQIPECDDYRLFLKTFDEYRGSFKFDIIEALASSIFPHNAEKFSDTNCMTMIFNCEISDRLLKNINNLLKFSFRKLKYLMDKESKAIDKSLFSYDDFRIRRICSLLSAEDENNRISILTSQKSNDSNVHLYTNVYKAIKHLETSSLAKEYGVDSPLFIAIKKHMIKFGWTYRPDIDYVECICNILFKFRQLEEYGYKQSRFYHKFIKDIVNQIIYANECIFSKDKGFRTSSSEILRDIDIIISSIKTSIDIEDETLEIIRDDIYSRCAEYIDPTHHKLIYHIAESFLNTFRKYEDDNSCFFGAHPSKESMISTLNVIHINRILEKIYKMHKLSKRLLPKGKELEMRTFFEGITKMRHPEYSLIRNINKVLEDSEDLAKPFSEYSDDDKKRLELFINSYEWVKKSLDIEKILPDLIRIFKIRN